jgi:hypothetical protein
VKQRDADLLTRRFGRLFVTASAERVAGRAMWSCLCDCGKTVVVRQNNLLSGNTTSCGCSKIRHGHARAGSDSPTYSSWQNMLARVDGKRGTETAKNYSDRGIGVCARWRSFDSFLEDMGPRPAGLTLDRIDNNRGYECGVCNLCVGAGRDKNCRWATRTDQQRNRRANVTLTHNGEVACLTDWALRLGISRSALVKRVNVWGIERALSTPVKGAMK